MLQDLYHHASYHPADKAIQYKKTIISYEQLDEYLVECSSLLSYDIYSKVILIVMNKGIELILSTLSVFLSKHVFCILDGNTTEDGVRRIVGETKTNVVFTDSKNFKKMSALSPQLGVQLVQFHFDEGSEEISLKSYGKPAPASAFELNGDISHIIYTSGSTAAPKGILCSRKALWNFIEWESGYLQIKTKVNVSQMSAPWFEPFLRDLFLPLFCGGCICIPTKREEFDPKAFACFINEKKIDVLHIVPTMFRFLFLSPLMKEHTIAHILLAGEMVYGTDVDKYYEKYDNGALYNLYGPSETTMARFAYKISKKDRDAFRIQVGTPLPDTDFLLIDESGEPVPEKDSGEVVIRTKQGSYGYCDKGITKKSFTFLKDGSTLFQTGDIGRINGEGCLELLGRRDFMRKIYGQKVYPEEIESAINLYPEVKKSIVVIEENKIIAMLETHKDFSIDVLSELIQRNLIPYKRPHYIYVVDKISVNKSGKLDRKYMQKISEITYTKKYMI